MGEIYLAKAKTRNAKAMNCENIADEFLPANYNLDSNVAIYKKATLQLFMPSFVNLINILSIEEQNKKLVF